MLKHLTGSLFRPSATALMLLAFIAFTLAVRGPLGAANLDLTSASLFSVSDGTKDVLSDLDEPIDLTLVYTRSVGQDYPAVRAYADRVSQLLESYDDLAGRNINLARIDPLPFSEAEDEALAAGLTAIETDGTDPLYFGLIGRNTVDDELVIPFLAPEREATLEYDLTRMIARLDKPVPATVGVLSSLTGMSGPSDDDSNFVLKEISKSFSLEPIPDSFVEVPRSVDILLIAHPPRLTEYQTYLIDQFLLAKGRALILVDPSSKAGFAGASLSTADTAYRSDLAAILTRHGIQISDRAIADVSTALPVSIQDETGREAIVGQPLFLGIGGERLDQTDPVTSVLSRGINFGSPGALTVQESSPLKVTYLAQTGDRPSYFDPQLGARNTAPGDVVAAYKAEKAPVSLAARLSGSLESAFPSGPVAPPVTGDPVRDQIAQSAAARLDAHRIKSDTPAELIVVADADLLDDSLYIDPGTGIAVADNAAFILNALDSLSGGADLLALRSRAPSLRPMTRILDMRAAAEARYFSEQAQLQTELATAQERLEELQQIGATGDFFGGDLEADLTDDERVELLRLREIIIDTRQRLRLIERDFRREIDGLERQLSLINIFGGAGLISLFGAVLLYRRRQRGGSA
ncbi:MAG: GldG family protein [Pseudomonadota bacterium]